MIVALGLLGIGLAWLLPGHYFPWTGFQQEVLAAGGALLLALAAVVSRSAWPPRLPAMTVIAWGLSLVPPLQWAAGLIPFHSDALLPTIYLLGLGLAALVGQCLAVGAARFDTALFSMLALAALATCTVGMLQWAQWQSPYIHALALGDRVYGNFTQPNHQASLLGLGFVALLTLRASDQLPRVPAFVGAAYLLLGLAMTQSRSGWLILTTTALLWLALRRRSQLALSAKAMAGLIVFCALAWWALPHVTRLMVGGTTASLADRAQVDSRWLHWQIIWDAVTRSPWWGYGWNQMSAAQQAAVLDHPPTFEWPSSSHNQLLDLAVWNGLPIGLLVLGALLWWSTTMLRRCDDARSWGALAALGALAAHAMVEFPLAYSYFLIPAGLLAGVAEARMGPIGIAIAFPRHLAAVVAASLAALLWLVADEYLQIEEGARRARYRDAGYAQHVPVPEVDLLDGPREYLRLWATRNEDGDPAADMAWLRTVSLRFPTPPALLRYATAAAVRGDAAQAERSLAILCRTALPKQCDEGRTYWKDLAQRHVALRRVVYPATPTR
jgi:O-antigen ligase